MSKDFGATLAYRKYHIGDYTPLKSIGQGSFAHIKLARHCLTGTEVAVKSINKRGLSRRFEELKSLKTLRHPNIIALFEVITTGEKDVLFMEHASGGDLYDHLQECGRKTEQQARPMFRQMISALHYCHQKGIVHRDLKPENILLDEDLNIKVADFGFSRDFANYQLTTVCGTFSYMAPEILAHQVYDGPKADVWSLGVTLYRMVTGDELFVGDTAGEVRKEIHTKRLHLPDFTSVEVQDLLQKMLTIDPSQRPTLDDIMKDTWVNMGEDEEMRPYCEPPWGDIDPQVGKIMIEMGFKEEEIQESLTQKKYDRIMGTYLILRMKTAKMQGRTIKVRPCPSSDPSASTSSSKEAETSIPSTSPAPSLDSSSSPSPGSNESRNEGPPCRLEVRMILSPRPSLHFSSSCNCIPGDTVPAPPASLHSSSSLSTFIPGEMVPSLRPSLNSSSLSTFIPGETVPRLRPSLNSSSSSTCIPGETVPAPPPSLHSSSLSNFIPGETVSSLRPSLNSSSLSTFIPGETVPRLRPSLNSSSSSTCIPGETVPAPPPSLHSSSSLSTFIPGETVPSLRPSLLYSSLCTFIPGETVPSIRQSLLYSPLSTFIPGEMVPSLRPSLHYSFLSIFIPGETVPSVRQSLFYSSLSTFIAGETVLFLTPNLLYSSLSTFIPGVTVPSVRQSLLYSSLSTCIPGETVPSLRPRLLYSSLSTFIPGETVASLGLSLHSSSSAYLPALEAKTSSPLPGPEPGTTAPSPALERGSEGSPTTHRSSQHISELGGGTPGSPSRRRHGRHGVARRVLQLLLKCFCCRPSTKKTRVTPV